VALSDDLEACVASGGVAVFPADTVYGLACDPESAEAVARLYALKGRAPDKPAAVMFFSLDAATRVLAGLGQRTAAAARALLPGPLTLLVPNPSRRYPLAGGGDVLGLRVPALPVLADVRVPVLQTSANLAGGPEAQRLEEVPAAIRSGADLVIDGGELPGVASTVLDLVGYESSGTWSVVRAGAVSEAAAGAVLGSSSISG